MAARLRAFQGDRPPDWDHGDTVGEFQIDTRVAAESELIARANPESRRARSADQETRVVSTRDPDGLSRPGPETSRTPAPAGRARGASAEDAETRATWTPAARASVASADDKETRATPTPARRVWLAPAEDEELLFTPPGARVDEVVAAEEKPTCVAPPPRRDLRSRSGTEDGQTISLRSNRWSRARPTTGVRARPRHARERAEAECAECAPTVDLSGKATRARQRRQTSPAAAPESLNLPVAILIVERMKLQPCSATITDISRSAAFVACSLQPLTGRRIVVRVASNLGAGVAVGYVQATFEGAGFAVRINASTEEFRGYVDALRGFARDSRVPPPRLAEPISMQIL